MARILIVEDEKLARLTLRKILQDVGHQVAEATNGVEGLAMFRAAPCDVVITDIIMPEKEGVAMIIELKRDFPDVRVIAISGGGRTRNLDFLKLAAKYGAQRVLPKPFSYQDLVAAVDAVLENPSTKHA